MDTLFISDLHLAADRPATTEALLGFLAGDARKAHRLYVLGDLFEYWIGDDHVEPHAEAVADGLRAVHEAGASIFFMAGNRDFLLGADFAARCGMRILSDPAVVLLGDRPVVLSHGDRYCIGDTAYQAFRRQVRDPAWIRAFLDRPVEERIEFAASARAESARETAGKSDEIMDVEASAIAEEMHRLGVDLLIHGHTHRPTVHHEADERCQRFVLGDWREDGAVILEATGNELSPRTLHFGST